jgi:multiple sugar transport system substrate-binding protein
MRYLYYLCVILFTLFSLFACTRAKPTKTIIRFLEAPDVGGGWKEIISRFEQLHPEIDVELVEGPPETNRREDQYTLSLMSREPTYDIIYMDIIWVSKFASYGWLIPLEDKFPPERQKEFLPGDIAGSYYQGKIYRVPMRSDAGVLYYRKDLLQKIGVDPPQTWDELVKIATRLHKPGELWGLVFQGRRYEGLICNFLELVWGAGGELIDKDGKVRIDEPAAVSALEWLSGVITRDRICPPDVNTYHEEASRHIFHQGRAIFMRNWPYAWRYLQEEGSPVKGKVGIVPMVHKKGHKSAACLGGWGFGISRFSRNPEAAWKFISFATNLDNQKILHLRNGAIPTRHALFKDPDILRRSPHYSELYKILLVARPRPAHPKYPQISDILQIHVSSALLGKKAPKEALKAAAEQIRTVLGSKR